MLFIWIALMVIALGGILWSAKIQKKNANAQTFAVIFLVLILVATGGILNDFGVLGGTSSEIKQIMENEKRFSISKANVIGKYLAEKYPDAKAVILLDSSVANTPSTTESLAELKKNLGKISIVATETINIPEPDPDNPMPYEEMVNAQSFNEIFALHKDVDLIINFANFPYNQEEVAKFSIWSMKNGPKLALYNGDIAMLKPAIQAGFVAVATTIKPKLDPKAKPARDMKETFDMRFLLITPDNVKEIAEQNPHMFFDMTR